MNMASGLSRELAPVTCSLLINLTEIADSYGLDKQLLLKTYIGYLIEYQDELYQMLEREMMK